MKLAVKITLLVFMFGISGCSSETRVSILQKCTILGDESIAYARANYVKLFYYFNAKKFNTPYQQVKDFDHVTHRNIINTYDIAVRKLKAKDPITETMLLACKNLAAFSKNLVDQTYPRAIAHESQYNPLSDQFFSQINQIVKFDDKIGVFDKNVLSFKQKILNYQKAIQQYREKFQTELSAK